MKKTLVAMGLLLAAISMPGFAATIGPNCGTCQGGVYTLTYETVSLNQGGLDTYNLFLTINTSLYTGGGTLINAVAPKIASSVANETLLGAPTALAGWTTTDGGLNANGCSGAGSGFICSEANSTATAASVSSITNSWSWQVQTTAGTSLLLGPGDASIKVQFTNSAGEKVGDLVSEGITLTPTSTSAVPEPSTWAMLGLGLCGAGLIGRRRSA